MRPDTSAGPFQVRHLAALAVFVICTQQSELAKLLNFNEELQLQAPPAQQVLVEHVIDLKLP